MADYVVDYKFMLDTVDTRSAVFRWPAGRPDHDHLVMSRESWEHRGRPGKINVIVESAD